MNRPIFIIGVPRSGTTLLQQILDRHSRISIFFETRFYLLLGQTSGDRVLNDAELELALQWVAPHLRRNDVSASAVAKRLQGPKRTAADLFDAMMKARMVARRKARFGEKTPLHHEHVDRLLKQYPDAQLIFIVRDPRRTYDSYKRFAPATVRRRDKTLVGKALQWNRLLRVLAQVERSQIPGRSMVVSFEQLVRQPEQTVRRICIFLGESFEPGMLAVDSANSSFDDLPANPGISRRVLERKTEISRLESGAIELICGSEMIRRGYTPQVLSPSLVQLLLSARYYDVQRQTHSAVRFLRRQLAI